MLGNMRYLRHGGERRALKLSTGVAILAAFCVSSGTLRGQGCTTQAKMTPAQRTEVGTAAYALASAVQAEDAARVQAGTVSQYAGDANQTAYLVRKTGQRIAGDTLAVTQAYLLDASARKAGDSSEAEFACPLSGTVSETDFGIAGLPAGRFAFVMVEAQGNAPWLLTFLLQQENGVWKMAGFYPHTRAAAGHDGLWYWTAARADSKAGKPWLAWMRFGEADQLLRPAGFVTTGNLDKLSTEQRGIAPEALTNGVNAQTPLTLQGAGGTVYQVTELRAQASDDAQALRIFMHIHAAPSGATPGETATQRNEQAARALLAAHPELRDGFGSVLVLADGAGSSPVTVERTVGELGATTR